MCSPASFANSEATMSAAMHAASVDGERPPESSHRSRVVRGPSRTMNCAARRTIVGYGSWSRQPATPSRHASSCVGLVLETVQQSEGRTREHSLVTAHLLESARDLGLSMPRTFEGLTHRSRALLQRVPGDLLRVGSRVRESDGELERARADAELGADRDVSRTGPVIHGGQVSVRVAQVDVHVRAAEVADRGTAERPDDADPHVLLLEQQGRRMCVEDAAEVTFGTRLP